MPDKKSVLFLVPYPLYRAPSQRFRVEQFLPTLEKAGITYRIQSFLDEKTWEVLYQNGSMLQKTWGVMKGFLRRLKAVCVLVPRHDYVFIHREASPIGPPVFEFIIGRLLRKKIIYDFDDAIWISNTTKENGVIGWLKAFWKISYLCKCAYKVVGGNQYLVNFARQFNSNVVLIPTCVDVEKHHNRLKNQQAGKITIGWTGSHSTMFYLESILEVLHRISLDFKVETIIISNKKPLFELPGMRFLPWKEATEIDDLLSINIGLMPLQADPWSEGKCGFKLIQYLALGIPAIASPVGVNKEIIEVGVNGFLCTTTEEWYAAIATLIQNEQKRLVMGSEGREKIVAEYSIQAHADTFINLFD